MARKNKIPDHAMSDIKRSKAASREAQLKSGLIPRAKSWGGKGTVKQQRQALRKQLRNEF